MSSNSGAGRPRTACQQCKRLKIRCSGDYPNCQRCVRLKNPCQYLQDAITTNVKRSRTRVSHGSTGAKPAHPGSEQPPAWFPRMPGSLQPETFWGIPEPLVSKLVETYFSHVYNAGLFFHTERFLQAMAAGTIRPYLLLSICAFGSVFYKDTNNQTPFKEYGFTQAWANHAGKLALLEAETPHEDNIVAFATLSLFWYTQGSWRRSYIHKGNAMQTAHLLDLSSPKRARENTIEAELARRRFWACYLINCHSSESMFTISAPEKLAGLPLPWRDEDFGSGQSNHPAVYLGSDTSGGGIYAELIRGMTHWSSVNSFIKSASLNSETRQASIYELDASIRKWWKELPERLYLSPSNITTFDRPTLTKVFFINAIYHQSLCALHSSIVPLFSWGPTNMTTELAEQFSAQIAYDNACAMSDLLGLLLEHSTDLGDVPSYLGFAAYCGLAIQSPFIVCLNPAVRQRAQRNIAVNMRVIRGLGQYWKFMGLIERYANYLTEMHTRHRLNLDDEPKGLSSDKLAGFRVTATRARESILSLNTILWKDDGYTVEGDEVADIGPSGESVPSELQAPSHANMDGQFGDEGSTQSQQNMATPTTMLGVPAQPVSADAGFYEGNSLDLFQPFLVSSELFTLEDVSLLNDNFEPTLPYDAHGLPMGALPYSPDAAFLGSMAE